MGSSFVRVLVGALVAIPVAIGLFFVMQSLISREYQQEDVESRKIADIVVPETPGGPRRAASAVIALSSTR